MDTIQTPAGWRNNDEQYGLISIVLHWAAAAAVLTLLATGLWAWAAPNHAVTAARLTIHGSIGVIALPVIALRVIWRIAERKPRSLDPGVLGRVAYWTHVVILVLITAQLISGPLDIWTGGWPIGVFGWFKIPPPIKGGSMEWHRILHNVHTLTGYTLAGLAALHIGAALKHAFIDRDRVVQRMLGLDTGGPAA